MRHVIIVAALVGWIAGASGGLLAGIAIVVTAQTRAIVTIGAPLPKEGVFHFKVSEDN